MLKVEKFWRSIRWYVLIIIGLTAWGVSLLCGNHSIDNFAISAFVGSLVWFLTTYLPDRKRDKHIRGYVLRRYRELRISLVQHVVMATERRWLNPIDAKRLSGYIAFRNEVKINTPEESVADVLANSLDDVVSVRDDIESSLDSFAVTLEFAMSQYICVDVHLLQRYGDLIQHIRDLRHQSVYLADRSRYLAEFVLEMLTCWSRDKGYEDYDWIEQTIEGEV